MRRARKASSEQSELAAEILGPKAPSGYLTSMSMGEFLSTTFGGAFLLMAVIAVEYGMIVEMLGISEAAKNRLSDKWGFTVALISGGVGLAVAAFGWGLWLRVIRWMVARFGAETFDRTATLRIAGGFVLVGVVGSAILGFVALLERLGV